MPFHPAPAPEDSVNALRVAAETLHPAHGQMVAMLRELSTNPQAHQPHKVYTVGLKDMAGDAGLSNKKLLGWRYLAQSDQNRNYAFLVHQDVTGHRFAEMNTGPFVEGTLRILADSQFDALVEAHQYELSALTIPALGVFAFLLETNATDQKQIAVVPPSPSYLTAWSRVYSLAEFQNAVRPAAMRKLASAGKSYV